MPYDALGNYVPGDEEPSLEEMRYALSQRPIEKATDTLKKVATQLNPFILSKQLQDLPRAAYNMSVAPLASTWAGALGNVQAAGAAKAYEALGMPREAEEARGRIEPVSPTNYQMPLQTPLGQQFQEGVGQAFEAVKAPHMWPVAVPHPGARPMLTPNDVRVMGAEATRVGRQVRDIPTDFANAQAGMQKLDPVTGQPTMGARLGQAERGAMQAGMQFEKRLDPIVTDILEKGGAPAELLSSFGPFRTHAVRPAGTTLTMPQNLPKGMEASQLPTGTATLRAVENAIGPLGTKATTNDIAGQLQWMRDHTPGIDQRAFGEFQKRKAVEVYPDAPTPDDAFEALLAATPQNERQLLALKHFDEFRQTPEGVAAGFGQLPSSTELVQRDEAARNWLQGPFINYIKKHFGAVGDPLVKLASEGITYVPKERIEPLDVDLELEMVQKRREAAGLPVEGTVQPALSAAQSKLSEAEAKVSELNSQRERYRDVAMQQGLPDPAQLPEYAKLTNQIGRAIAERDRLTAQVQNLELGKLYESRVDVGVEPRTPESILKGMEYSIKQFYPSVTRAKPGEKLYTTRGSSALRNLGYDQFASEFYNKVLEGEIPVDKLKSLTVEKAVRQLAEPRIAKEKAAARAALTYKTDAETVMKNTMQTYVKPENYFGNVGAIELTKDMSLDVPTMTRILSEDTTVLDHCIAEGGRADEKNNPWFPGSKTSRDAIYNIVTGQKNPGAGRDTSAYVNSVLAGDMMTSFRDANTGVPVATFQFNRSHIGQDGQQKYNIGYASGHKNGEVNPEYVDGIKDYLNSRKDSIASIGHNASANLGIYDTQDLSTIRRDLSLKRNDMELVDWESLPRFITDKEIKATIDATKELGPAAASAQVADTPSQALYNDIQAAVNNAFDIFTVPGPEAAEAAQRFLRFSMDFNERFFAPTGPREGLNRAMPYLEQVMDNYRRNLGGQVGELMANAIGELLVDLDGIRSAQARGHYDQTPAPAAAPAPVATQTFSVHDFDAFVGEIRQDLDAQIAHDIVRISNIAADALGTNVRNALEHRPTEFAQRLTDQADLAENGLLEDALRELADRIAPPIREVNLDFEPDVGHPANVPTLNVQDMAFELFQDTRRGEGRDLNELQTTLQALETGNFDDMRFRALPADQRDRAQRDVAHQIRAIMDDLNITLPAEPQAQPPAVAPFIPIAEHAASMTYDQLREDLTPREIAEVTAMHDDIVRNNPTADEIRTISQLVYDHQMGPWEQMPDTQRAMLYMELLSTANRMGAALQRQAPVVAQQAPARAPRLSRGLRASADNAIDRFLTAVDEAAGAYGFADDVTQALNELRAGEDRVRELWDEEEPISPALRAYLIRKLERVLQENDGNDNGGLPQRRGPFQPGGSSAVRGLPLGNLNLRPAITAEMLRGPDTQPVRNFVQQVGNLPGVTQEGLRTGLMAFEQMDPTRRITKAEFVRELLPSSYDIVDLRGASQENQHLMDAAQDAFDQDASPVGDALGLKGAQLTAWANAVRTQYNDYDSFPANVKRALAKQGIEDANEYAEAYDIAYRDALETYVANYAGSLADEDGYTYANTQRLVQPSMGDAYGEFGVTHPDQRGTYHHFDLAPQGVIGHFRGTYNPADPITLTYWDQQGNEQSFDVPDNSYVIEEIQSDAQKIAQQTGHLHQVHGVLFKAAIQKALESGATTVYMPTAAVIAKARSKNAASFAPIYDQAIIKEGLKPLLKIPGVTSKMVNGYHEISFTPEAIEHILNGPGQSVPGYKKGGQVKAYQAGGQVSKYPGLFSAQDEAIERSREMYPSGSSQDDQSDAARHMLAAGYAAQSLGPTIAKGLGYLHELKDAPIRTAGSWLGLTKPRYDYEMDVHNNALGAELAKRAKDRADFERLVQESIAKGTTTTQQGRARLMTPEQAKEGRGMLKYANGGTVQQPATLDEMKLALQQRSK